MPAVTAAPIQPAAHGPFPGRTLMVAGLLIAATAFGAYTVLPKTAGEPGDEEIRAALIATLRDAAPRERLEADIAAALDRDEPEQAGEYVEVADLLGVPLDPSLRQRWTEESSGWRNAARMVRRATEGAVTGEGEDAAAIAAALAADLTVVGDIRDLAGQASRMVKGEPVDELVLGLSIAGVALTAVTVTSAGGALPAKAGVSLSKLARKTGKLSVRFQEELGRIVAKAADVPAFRQAVRDIPWYRLDALGAAAGRHAARIDTAEVQRVLGSMGAIGKVASPAGTLAILRHVDGVNDLRHAERATRLLGKPASGAFRLMGRQVLTVTARTVKVSMASIAALVTAVMGVASFLLGALATMMTLWRLRKLVRPGRP